MLRGAIIAAALGILIATGLPAEEPVSIKLKRAGQGESFWTDQLGEIEFLLQLTSDGKVADKHEQKSAQRFVFRETVLEKKPHDKRATRVEREYERAEVAAGGRARPFAYQGWTVLIEKQDGGYRFRIKGGDDLSENDAPYLHREFNDAEQGKVEDDLFLPKGPVALNAPWPIETRPLIENFEKSSPLRVDAAKATAAGKLLKVYRRDGRLYGVLSVHVELPLTTYTFAANKFALKDGARAVIDTTVDACIDGSSVDGRLEMTTEVTATSTQPGPDGKDQVMTLSIRTRRKELHSDFGKH